ncbi:MAG: glycosyl hydrolase, partial [Woeseiaceae bacterium]
WQPLQLNLPVVPVTDLAVRDGDLVAATQGRGFWILDHLTVLRQLEPGRNSEARLYRPAAAYRLPASENPSPPVNEGSNPPPGVVFYYTLPAEPAAGTPVELSVRAVDASDPIWTWTREPGVAEEEEERPDDAPPDTRVLTAEAGLNRHVWDLRYSGMERFEKLILWNDMKTGPVAAPGVYRATLRVGDTVQEAPFELRPDPRAAASPADYAAQFRFVIECRDLLSETHRAIARIRAVRTQLEPLAGRLSAAAGDAAVPLSARIDELNAAMNAVEQALYQTQNESRQDPLNFPIRLNDKLSGVMRQVATGNAAPTQQALAVKAELSTAIRAQLATLDTLWSEQLPALNAGMRALGIDLVAVPTEPP